MSIFFGTVKHILICMEPELISPLEDMPCPCGDDSCAILEMARLLKKTTPSVRYVPKVYHRFEINFDNLTNLRSYLYLVYDLIKNNKGAKLMKISLRITGKIGQLILTNGKTTIIIGSVIIGGVAIGKKLYKLMKKTKSAELISDETTTKTKNLEEKTIPLDSDDTLPLELNNEEVDSDDEKTDSDDAESEVENEDFQ